jgi:hypothetical protein
MQVLKLMVPTFNGSHFPGKVSRHAMPEYGRTETPVLVCEADGVRIILGSHDYHDFEKPDIYVERQPNGWAVFLHPSGGGDPSGMVYFLDDGKSYLLKEDDSGTTPPTIVVEPGNGIPGSHFPG